MMSNPVINALRANGIDVTAVHSHMLDEHRDCSSFISGPMKMH